MPPADRSPEAAESAIAGHATMVAQLRRPGACGGHPQAAGLIETHLSSLLLAGELVYKLKKPLLLPFVDFSTPARRHVACLQELRLNRRTAPQWYLSVLPVQLGEGGALIAAPSRPPVPGDVIDWAVQMRRFDDHQLFDRLAREGRLGAAQIDRLAEVVVAFHAAQSPLLITGCAEASLRVANDNVAELAARVAGTDLADAVAALRRWTERRGAELATLMNPRALAGQVRDGHGDLHLGNIVWADDTALLFDTLEFDDSLRQTDRVADLAFPFMDLLAHGLPRLAWRFASATLEATGDWAALPLLLWWAVQRAAVRAKVALLAVPAGADALAQTAPSLRARRYLDVAAALAAAPRPRLMLMMGLSGSGKTAVAGVLAEQLGGVRLRSDVERKRLFGLAPNARAEPSLGLYTADATRRTYERLQALASTTLQAGVPVVIDAASLKRNEREAMRTLARRLGVPFQLVLCEAPQAVLRERLARRQAAGRDASDATTDVLDQQLQFTDWPAEQEAGDLLRIATDQPWPALEQHIVLRAACIAAL